MKRLDRTLLRWLDHADRYRAWRLLDGCWRNLRAAFDPLIDWLPVVGAITFVILLVKAGGV